MARGVNKVILVGNLGADPEKRATASGTTVTNLSLATTEQWTDKQSGDKREETEWHRVVMFGRLGDIAAQYLSKGRQVYIEGRIRTRKWQGQDGQDRYTTEVIANDMQMLGGGGGGGSSSGGGSGGYGGSSDDFGGDRGGRSSGSSRNNERPSGGQQGGGGGAPQPDFDDDIPF